jgi:hypothetical protein
MDPKMLAIELRKAGVQLKIVRLLRGSAGCMFGPTRRHPKEAARADKIVAFAWRSRAKSDGECGQVCVHGAVGGGPRGKVPGGKVSMRTICPCPQWGQSRSDTPVRR